MSTDRPLHRTSRDSPWRVTVSAGGVEVPRTFVVNGTLPDSTETGSGKDGGRAGRRNDPTGVPVRDPYTHPRRREEGVGSNVKTGAGS